MKLSVWVTIAAWVAMNIGLVNVMSRITELNGGYAGWPFKLAFICCALASASLTVILLKKVARYWPFLDRFLEG